MTSISAALRREVVERAQGCCEYCLVHSDDRFLPYHIDHILAEKHGGKSISKNLCYSCYLCNRYKGSDVSSVEWSDDEGEVIPLFHPRKQRWSEHFQLEGAIIAPLTPNARVTIRLLRLNDPERLIERDNLIAINRYPCR